MTDSATCCETNPGYGPIFGDRFPYPDNGKRVMLHLVETFAQEFNLGAEEYFRSQNYAQSWNKIAVTSAYPTTKKQCPSIAVIQTSSRVQPSGIGNYLDQAPIEIDGVPSVRIFHGQVATDTIEIAISTLSPKLRDDLSMWFGQWMLDALLWFMPQLPSVHSIQRLNVADDTPEYTGCAGQPGFQFYLASHTYQVEYDEIVLHDVDRIKSVINWQELVVGGEDC